MSAGKKTWVNSMFSQLSATQPLNSTTTSKTPVKTFKRSSSFTETTASTVTTRSKRNKESLTKTDKTRKNNKHINVNSDNWIDSFAPATQDDLAIHAKKLQELEDWFCHCDVMRKQYPAQICLVTGPSGVGKTAAVRVHAETHKYALHEWINPIDREVIHNLGDQYAGDGYVGSQVDAFKSFLLRASRYKSLLDTHNKRLLLVEDFPNALINDVATFEEILGDYMNYGKSPLIFIVADAKTRGLNISYNLFTDQLKMKYRVTHISFNPIASTLLHKAMKRFCAIMRQDYGDMYKVPQQSVIDSIVVSAQGDIRNALINLHFSSLKGAPVLETMAMPTSGTEKSKRKRENKLKSVGRDESVTMMHALGRVFNPKFQEDKKLLHSPEEIAEQFTTEPKKFIDFVHANYLPHYRHIENVVTAGTDFCIADVLMREYREEMLGQVGLNIGVRSVMTNNAIPISAWLPTRGPKRLSNVSVYSLDGSVLISPTANITTAVFAKDYSTYAKIISKNGSSGVLT